LAVAVLALAPWAAAFWGQARQVRAEYWIPPATLATMAGGLARWALGADAGAVAPLVALTVAASMLACLRAGGAGRFLVVQAAAPWILGLAASWLSGRPIVLDRYMLFALPFLLGAWAVGIAALPRPAFRAAAAAALIA